MLNNYKYFITLAEELNITSAATRLYISHQCLSKYLKNLEENYGVLLIERKPKMTLTDAGKLLLENYKKIEWIEENIENQFIDIKEIKTGKIKIGITEGRYSIIVPKIIKRFNDIYPNIECIFFREKSIKMQELIRENTLDLFISGTNNIKFKDLKIENIMNEELFLIISDNLLKKYFPQSYPKCKENFLSGVDLKEFINVPFILNESNFNSRIILEKYLEKEKISLRCKSEVIQPDIQYSLCAEDYAACFCLTMYLKNIHDLNRNTSRKNKLNIFPIKNFEGKNPLGFVYHKDKIFPKYVKELKKIISEIIKEKE